MNYCFDFNEIYYFFQWLIFCTGFLITSFCNMIAILLYYNYHLSYSERQTNYVWIILSCITHFRLEEHSSMLIRILEPLSFSLSCYEVSDDRSKLLPGNWCEIRVMAVRKKCFKGLLCLMYNIN